MKKNTFLGIGTLIVTDEIVVAYVDVILNIIKNGGATFEDTRNICETLMFLRDNYKGNEAAWVHLDRVTNSVYCLYLDNIAPPFGDYSRDLITQLLAVKAILV